MKTDGVRTYDIIIDELSNKYNIYKFMIKDVVNTQFRLLKKIIEDYENGVEGGKILRMKYLGLFLPNEYYKQRIKEKKVRKYGSLENVKKLKENYE